MPPWLTNFESISHLRLFNPATSAAVNKFLLGLLNQNNPVDIHTNHPTSFSDTNQNPEKHHIFPTAYLNSIIDPGNLMEEKDLKSHRMNIYKSDSMLNRMIISQETNNQVISDLQPSVYLSRLVENGLNVNTLKDRLSRAYINGTAYNHLMEDNYDQFILARSNHLLQVINGIAGKNLVVYTEAENEDGEPAEGEVDFDEQALEYIEHLGDSSSD